MARDVTFVEVKVRRGLFSRRGQATRRFDLPLSWTVNRRRARLFFGPIFLSAFVLVYVFIALTGHFWFGISGAAFFACFAYPVTRTQLGLYRLGPGRIMIDSDGFTDDRLRVGRIPWRCMRRSFTFQDRRSSRVRRVLLLLDGARFTEAVSDDYRSAYLFLKPRKRPPLFIDLAGNADGREIAEAIRILIEAAQFD